MEFYLIHGRNDVRLRLKIGAVLRPEVRHADRPDPPIVEQLLERLVRCDGFVESALERLVKDEKGR